MFKLPEEVKKDLENYKNSLKEFLDGKETPARFRGVRVPWGIYSHRGGKAFMTRIRIPAGVVSASQLKALSNASCDYGDGVLHITTRQDIQLHNVPIENTIKVMEYLKEYNLSPRGGGGNTVRNITACPLSQICCDEIFDVRPYAAALSEYLLREETSFNLPRKFKITFSGCSSDCAGCLVNDVGFFAKLNNGKKGFKVFAGGGMGASSRVGKLLEDFLPEEDLGYCVEAVKNIFYHKGDRRDKHHNRLRFLIDNIGIDEFKTLYKKEFKELKDKEYIVLRKAELHQRSCTTSEIPKIDDKEYQDFLKYSVYPQKQAGFCSIELRIPRGDISFGKLLDLADLEKEFSDMEFRTSPNQNLCISWVKNEDVYKLFGRIKDILEDFLYPETLLDIVACKGALTCNLGLCNSPGAAGELGKVIKEGFIGKKVFDKFKIKINGCPNACGQHPIGEISFYGAVKRIANRPVPFYKFLLGGRKEAEQTRFAEEVGIIPAKNLPSFLKDFLSDVDERLDDSKDKYTFLEKEARGIAEELLKKYAYVPSYTEDRNFYIDWGGTREFSLDGLGPGECGAGVIDMIEADLIEAKLAIESAEGENYSAEKIKRAIFLSSRALLIVKGIDPRDEKEAFSGFREKFIGEGIALNQYGSVEEIFNAISISLSLDERKVKFLFASDFFEHINKIYKSMDSSFNFPKIEVKSGMTLEKKKETEKAAHLMDLKGTPCPINYVKAKLVLENLNSGDVLEIFLDEGEPISNVPKSLENDGHKILKIEKLDGFYRVIVKKG